MYSLVITALSLSLSPVQTNYAFCHEVLADFIDKFDNYANFKDMI